MNSTPSPNEKGLFILGKPSYDAYKGSKSNGSNHDFESRSRAASGRSADFTNLQKNKNSTASFEQLPRNSGSFEGFADKVRQQQFKSSTSNTTTNDKEKSAEDKSAEDKSASNEDKFSQLVEQRDAFYKKAYARRSLSYNKSPNSPSWRNGNCGSSDMSSKLKENGDSILTTNP